MEGSAAAGPAAAAGDGAGGGEAEAVASQQQADQQAQQQQGVDPGLLQQLADVPGQLEQLRSWMESQVGVAEPQPQDPYAGFGPQQFMQPQQQPMVQPGAPGEQPSLDFMDPNSPYYNPQAAAGQLLQLIGQQNQQQLQEALAPVQEQVAEQRASQEADALATEFPELADPQTANEVLDRAKEWAQAAGLPEAAAGNMQVVRAVYLMGRAMELNQQERDANTPPAATLEGAGGASPGGAGGQQFTAESIVGAARRSVLPFG